MAVIISGLVKWRTQQSISADQTELAKKEIKIVLENHTVADLFRWRQLCEKEKVFTEFSQISSLVWLVKWLNSFLKKSMVKTMSESNWTEKYVLVFCFQKREKLI